MLKLFLPGMIAYSYKKIVASSRDVVSWLNEQGLPTIWLPMAGELGRLEPIKSELQAA